MTDPAPAPALTAAEDTAARPARTPRGFRVSARARILLWLLLVLTVALSTVILTSRAILLRDVDARINELLTQETAEFGNFVERGRDPENGQRFTDPHRLLRVYLERQQPDHDEELLGLVGTSSDPRVIRQSWDSPSPLPLHRDAASLRKISAAQQSSGTLDRPEGELRWAKVPINAESRGGDATFIVGYHPERSQATAEKVVRMLVSISALALLLIGGIGWLVAGTILAPVRLVRTTAAKLTEQDLTQRIPVRGRDDVSALAETFNGMLDRLERAFATQRTFVDDAGHELRTPITIVRGHLELMSTAPEHAAEREETVRLVTDELDRMSRIVEDLLLLAKAERPDFVQPETAELAELTADVFVKVRALGERRWELDGVAEGTWHLDVQRVTQAMVQLAQNAVQHTTTDQRIRIGSRLTDGRLELYVADVGPGVSPEDAGVIFERFRRGTARRGTRGSGAGLGLSIVTAIAEGHGGRVELRPTPGGGATFVLVLERT